MTEVNAYQISGIHYKGTAYQHWDFVFDTGMGYLEGNATKYVARHHKKGGVIDLQKALHYVCKLETCTTARYFTNWKYGRDHRVGLANRFSKANTLGPLESTFMRCMVEWDQFSNLMIAKDTLFQLIARAEAQGQKPEVVRTEENHHEESTHYDPYCGGY